MLQNLLDSYLLSDCLTPISGYSKTLTQVQGDWLN